MDKVLVTPVVSDALYSGRFIEREFQLLASPIPVYRSFLKHFVDYGVTLDSFQLDTASLSTAVMSCSLAYDVTVSVRIERLDIAARRLQLLTEEKANDVLIKSWMAIKEVDSALAFSEHSLALNIYASLQNIKYDAVLRRYLAPNLNLREGVNAGITFHVPESPERGEKPGTIGIDRIGVYEDAILLRVTMAFDANMVSLESFLQKANDYVTRELGALAIELKRT